MHITETGPALRVVTRDDVRASIIGMALAAHGSGSLTVTGTLAASAARLVGRQIATPSDLEQFVVVVERVAELDMVRSGLLPEGIAAEHSAATAFEIAVQEASEACDVALDQFGA